MLCLQNRWPDNFEGTNLNQEHIEEKAEQSEVTRSKDPKATNYLVSVRPPKNTEKLRIDARSRSGNFSFILHKQN